MDRCDNCAEREEREQELVETVLQLSISCLQFLARSRIQVSVLPVCKTCGGAKMVKLTGGKLDPPVPCPECVTRGD